MRARQRWQALSDSVGISLQFNGKAVKLVDVERPAQLDLDLVGASSSLSINLTYRD